MEKLVLQSDFGLSDGAVAAMYGVAYQVNKNLSINNLTHDITPYSIFEASYRLYQTLQYWPSGTVFVSVVDPGVGSNRRSLVIQTMDNQYIITPDNGTVSHVIEHVGVKEVRVIDETTNSLSGSQESHTFHGRDIYAYNGARLASGNISFEELGTKISTKELIVLNTGSVMTSNDTITGIIDILDVRFGSLWTNISSKMFRKLHIYPGDFLQVSIYQNDSLRYQNQMPFTKTFAEVSIGEPLVYVNSLLNIGVAVNQDSFSKLYHIGTGNEWKIKFKKI